MCSLANCNLFSTCLFFNSGTCGGFLQIAWLHMASSNCNSTHREL
ncbi:unnamed protein product [Staurois parvus]|uniref:Uncharacterized protein n=1 Tax=Staurois parvus TaxID=386267 RepID=A0ABN9CTG1_9NEOB|nr:unnamed protein product [Staurois parvus]